MYRGNYFQQVKYYCALAVLIAICVSIGTVSHVNAKAEELKETTGAWQRADYGKTPLLFEENKGQTDKQAKFVSRGKAFTLYLANTEAIFSLKTSSDKSDILRMKFAGGNTKAQAGGTDEAITKTNYYKGKKRFENISNYGRVSYKNIYNGINAVFYGDENNSLEYDLNLAPNADPDQIKLKFTGAEKLSINENGKLVIKTANAELTQHKPYSYQLIDGQRREVESSYELAVGNNVKFKLAEYDHAQPLVIDPVLKYLTYIGGSEDDEVSGIAADKDGNAYITGFTESLDFPVPNSRLSRDGYGVFVAKIDPTGHTILFKTFLDGSSNDGATGHPALALGPGGTIFITATVDSRNYPTTANSYQPNKSICVYGVTTCALNVDAALTKLDTAGNIVYSTFLGGPLPDTARDVAVDSSGRAYVVGDTYSGVSFPKKNEFQSTGLFGGGSDAFLTVFNADGTDIIYSTGLGGSSSEFGNSIALDSDNNAYIAGQTGSNGQFPVKNAFQSESGGGKDVFVAKFNPFAAGDASLIYSTFIGGGGTDAANGIAVDRDGQAYITGLTGSFNFPLKGAFRSTNQINEAFVTILNASGNGLVNSSFLGGSDQEEGTDITLGNGGAIFVTGNTHSDDFPVSAPFQASRVGNRDAFVTKLRFGQGIIFSSFLGGNGNEEGEGDIAVAGNSIYFSGGTASNNLSTTGGVIRASSNASEDEFDGFVAKILDSHVDSVGIFRSASTFLITQSTANVLSETVPRGIVLSGQKGIAGDFDGDGIDTVGSFSNGTWKTRDNDLGAGVRTFTFGGAGDLPVVGDWNGDGVDTVGVFRPSTAQFTLTDTADNPGFAAKVTKVNFGVAGDLPIAGDWNGDGKDSIAVFRPSTGQTFFTNEDLSVRAFLPVTLSPAFDQVAFLGANGDLPVGGDWNGDGIESLGVWRPSTGEFFLSDDNVTLRPVFGFGKDVDQPLAGDWDGKPNP